MLNYILSLERAINRVPLGMELVSLQGLPLCDTRHKGAARAKTSLFCLARGNPTCMAPPSGTSMHSGYSDICLFNNKHFLEA